MPLTRPTTTPMPDEIFDEWAPRLGEAELKVLLYIVRRTLGFRKEADAISLTQFTHGIMTAQGRILDHGCGVTNRSNVVRALKSLEARGVIRAVSAHTIKGDRAVTTYALWWAGDVVTAAHDSGGPEKGLGGSAGPGRGWSSSEHKVVPDQDHGSAAARPTTNSLPTHSQQNSETTRAPIPAREALARAPDGATPPPFDDPAAVLWQAVLDDVREAMTAANFNAWFAPTRVLDLHANVLRVAVPDSLEQEWLDTKLRWHVERALRALGQDHIHVTFTEGP